jgi:hypothetical protein
MKLLKGEKTGLKTGLSAIRFLWVFFFPLFYSYSQVPINGFCRFNSFEVEPGCDGLFAGNFNNDSYTDIVLFNSQKKKISVYAGEQNGGFSLKRKSNIQFEISNIQNLTDKNKLPLGQIVISRKSRRLALSKINNAGGISFADITKLNSFPENISYSDANRDGKQEVLVSGGAFDGLSVFSSAEKGFREKKIARKTCFSFAAFCDLNNDGFSDIAAFNIFSKKLIFYFNNSLGDFREVRNIQFDRQISQLQAVNIDFDAYQDLVYSKDNSINFLLGDSVASYYKTLTVPTRYKPDKFIFGDFNRDGRLDIAYISVKDSILSVIYSKNFREFYPEIVYFRKEGVNNIIPYYSKFIDGLAVLSSAGKLYTVTKMNAVFDDVQITAGIKPTMLNYFDKANNGIYDFYYVDETLKTINFYLRNNAGVPGALFQVKFYQVPSRIEIDNYDKWVKTFYCFTTDKKLIEIIRVDFSSNKVEHSSLYVPGGIKDLKIKRLPDNPVADIFVAYSKYNDLNFSQYQFRDYHYVVVSNEGLAKNVYDARLSIGRNQYCYAWYWNNNKIVLSKIALNNNFQGVNLFSLDAKNISGIASLVGDILNLDKDFFVSFLKEGEGNSVLVNSERMTRFIKKSEVPDLLASQEIKKYHVGESRFNRLKKVYVYNDEQNAVYVLDFLKKGKNLIFTKLIDAGNVNDFFIKNMSGKDFHIVYTDGSEHNIRIKKL